MNMFAEPLENIFRMNKREGQPLWRTMYLETVASETSMTSLRNSPCIRGAPQSGFAKHTTESIAWFPHQFPDARVFGFSIASSSEIPDDASESQSAGRTMCKTLFQPIQHRLNITQNRRSESVNCGRGARNFSVASCCRRARFSSTNSRWSRTLDRSIPRIISSHFHIEIRPLDSKKR